MVNFKFNRKMKIFIILFFIFASFQLYSQSDSLVLFKERPAFEQTGYSFGEGQWFYSPSVGFSKNTKNNLGFEVEYAASNLLGIVGGISTSSFNDSISAVLNSYGYSKTSFTGLSFGLRGHSGYIAKSKKIDIMPGIYWAKFFDPDKVLESSSQLYGGIDLRFFIRPRFAINISASIAFEKGSNPGYGIGLIFR